MYKESGEVVPPIQRRKKKTYIEIRNIEMNAQWRENWLLPQSREKSIEINLHWTELVCLQTRSVFALLSLNYTSRVVK